MAKFCVVLQCVIVLASAVLSKTRQHHSSSRKHHEQGVMDSTASRDHPFATDLALLLETVSSVLEASELQWHITNGSLLGMQRRGGKGDSVIPWDSDIDIAVLGSDSQIEATSKTSLLSSFGFKMVKEGIWRVYDKKKTSYADSKGKYVDLYKYECSEQSCSQEACSSGSPHCENDRRSFKREMIFPTVICEFVGVPVRCPAAVEPTLEWIYGPDWKTPDHVWVGGDEGDEGAGWVPRTEVKQATVKQPTLLEANPTTVDQEGAAGDEGSPKIQMVKTETSSSSADVVSANAAPVDAAPTDSEDAESGDGNGGETGETAVPRTPAEVDGKQEISKADTREVETSEEETAETNKVKIADASEVEPASAPAGSGEDKKSNTEGATKPESEQDTAGMDGDRESEGSPLVMTGSLSSALSSE